MIFGVKKLDKFYQKIILKNQKLLLLLDVLRPKFPNEFIKDAATLFTKMVYLLPN